LVKSHPAKIGILNCVALLVGFSFLVDSVFQVLTGRVARLDDAPYFRLAFVVMTVIELGFFSIFLTTAVGFIRAKLSSANLYSLAVLLCVFYFVVSSMLGRVGSGVGASIGAASAGNATTPFIFLFLAPFLYPIVSVISVQLLRWRFDNPQSAGNA
jgi:hypothetical protein